jgi:hypothetical protein
MYVSINTHLMRFKNRFGILSQLLNAPATNCASALTGITRVGVKSVTFQCEYLDGEGDVGFIYFVLHSIYILDCYHIFTRLDLNFLLVFFMN